MTKVEEHQPEALLRLAEGWCPHTQHGRLVPVGVWGRCDDACGGGHWRRDGDRLLLGVVGGGQFVEVVIDVHLFARIRFATDALLNRAVQKAWAALFPPDPRGEP